MLVGELPFKGSGEKTLLNEIHQKSINYDEIPISTEAKNLLKGLLERNPKKRMTAHEALSSPFFLKNTSKSGLKLKRQITVLLTQETNS